MTPAMMIDAFGYAVGAGCLLGAVVAFVNAWKV